MYAERHRTRDGDLIVVRPAHIFALVLDLDVRQNEHPVVIGDDGLAREVRVLARPVVVRNGVAEDDALQADVLAGNGGLGERLGEVLRESGRNMCGVQLLARWIRIGHFM